MKVFRIVLTGGPCAGKTTIINNIKKELKEKNIPCLIVPEAATQLIDKGFDPNEWDTFEFQSEVLIKQLFEEAENQKYIDKYSNTKKMLVIIYDRGIYDNKAYFNDNTGFKRLLSKFSLDDMQVLDSYDMVFDLLSVATCKPEAYTLENNEARSESFEDAQVLDKKTSNVWANHRNMKIISSEVSVEEETENVLKYIYDFINEENVVETYKYLVDEKNSDMSIYNDCECITINDTYLKLDDSNHIYKLSERIGCGRSFVLDAYIEIGNKKINIESTKLNEDEYKQLYNNYEHLKYESRKELGFVDNETLYKLCYYRDKTILEVQKNDFNDIKIPNNIKVIKDFEEAEIKEANNKNTDFMKKLLYT